MELSIVSPWQHVTWKVRDFLQVAKTGCSSLYSPEIRFAGGSYCLRLIPFGNDTARAVIRLSRVNSTKSVREISCKLGYRQRNGKGDEFDNYFCPETMNKDSYRLQFNLQNRDVCDPNGTLTVLCSMRLSGAGNPHSEEISDEEEQKELPEQSVFLSRWMSSKMELSIESSWQHVTWKVKDFFQLPSEIGYSLDSPEFRFAGDSYCLRLYPYSDTDIHLVRLTSTFPERILLCKVGCKMVDRNGQEVDIYQCPSTVNNKFRFLLVSRSELEEERVTWFPDSALTVLFSMRLGELSTTGSPESEDAGTSEMKQEGLPRVAKLLSEYKQLLQKGAESDACVVVSGKEFRAHRCVLRARSPVFDAMFAHDTAEKESGRVVIDDLDPKSFGEFLEFLYTGGIGAGLSNDNAFGLYAAANKYDVPTLKSECVAHMRRTLTVDSFYDVMTLALRHRQEDLLQSVFGFFKDNLPRIIVTEKWQQFMTDDCKSANELFIKTFVPRGQ